jgi:hypothetical protein
MIMVVRCEEESINAKRRAKYEEKRIELEEKEKGKKELEPHFILDLGFLFF